MPALVAAIGVLLILIAIPFGLMLAPLVLGALFVWYSLGRLDAAVASPDAGRDERALLGFTAGSAAS
jgi:hypothetical protein